ncbi:MAG TPA: signal peptidase II [Rhodospirillales bacterium]|nr:signal peptidase II [Rhodospirillales bacterium]
MTLLRCQRLGLWIALTVVIVDQLSKWWIVSMVMQPPRVIPVLPFFNLVMGWNRGVSFGLFNSDSALNDWLLPLIALVIVAFLLAWMWRAEKPLLAAALGSVIGGAIGNVIDRFNYGSVADFLDVYVAGYHWPAFNLADAGISIGAIILVVDSLFSGPEKTKLKD